VNTALRVKRLPRWAAILGIPIAVHAAAPSAGDMARCLALAAPETRLACYDALAHRWADATPGAAAAEAQAAAANPASTTAPPPAAAVPPAAAPPAAAPPSAAAPAPTAAGAPGDPKNFGLTLVQQHVADAGPTSIQARIVQISADHLGHAVIVLDSGQTWKVTDDDGWLSQGDRVTIKRAALASFLLVAPSNHTYRVRRIE
jgi:hypothetical protein